MKTHSLRARFFRPSPLVWLTVLCLALTIVACSPRRAIVRSFTELQAAIIERDFSRARQHCTEQGAAAWWLAGLEQALKKSNQMPHRQSQLVGTMFQTYCEMLKSARIQKVKQTEDGAEALVCMKIVSGEFQAMLTFPTKWVRENGEWRFHKIDKSMEELANQQKPITDSDGKLIPHAGYPLPFGVDDYPVFKAEEDVPPQTLHCPEGMAPVPAGLGVIRFSGQRYVFADEKDRQVKVEAFCIDRYEASRPDATVQSGGFGAQWPAQSKPGVLPWVKVTWGEAKAACERAGKRLCTGIEWQKAAGGGQGRLYPYGNLLDHDACNTYTRAGQARELASTGAFTRCRSPYGVYDTCGNVSEWVADLWQEGMPDRVLRGGSFNLNPRNDQGLYPFFGWQMNGYGESVAAIHHHWPHMIYDDDGFRCCADPRSN